MQKKVINHFIDCIKKSRQRMLIEKGDKYYLSIVYHKYICEDFEIYLDEVFVKVFDKFDKVEAIDSKSPVRISMKGHILGYLMPVTIKEN